MSKKLSRHFPPVAEALARYIHVIRPSTPHPQLFVGLQSPQHPLSRARIYKVVSPRFLALGIEVIHHGPHALRHACAMRLIADGLTLKEIGDHLGHRSTEATRTYAKVALAALREVGTSTCENCYEICHWHRSLYRLAAVARLALTTMGSRVAIAPVVADQSTIGISCLGGIGVAKGGGNFEVASGSNIHLCDEM